MLCADADWAAAGKAAHRLGGAAAILGFAELSAAARAFEAAAQTGADLASQRQVVGSRIDEALTRLGALRLHP